MSPAIGDTWPAQFERLALQIESAVVAAPGSLTSAVPYCAGWAVRDVLEHLGLLHRRVFGWIREGRRPRDVGEAPAAASDPEGRDLLAFYAAGWRELHGLFASRPAAEPAATWSPWDATIGFWGRRQVHELAIHAFDVLSALGRDDEWADAVPAEVAQDGVDEVVRLWLGTRLADQAGGDGCVVRLVSTGDGELGERFWTVGLHGSFAEVHDLPTPPDAVVSAPPHVLYRWLWGRAEDHEPLLKGEPDAVAALQAALIRVTQ